MKQFENLTFWLNSKIQTVPKLFGKELKFSMNLPNKIEHYRPEKVVNALCVQKSPSDKSIISQVRLLCKRIFTKEKLP